MSMTALAKEPNRSGLMTVGQAAQTLYVHRDTLRRWGARGLVKTYRVGPRGDRRFSRSEIVRMLRVMGA